MQVALTFDDGPGEARDRARPRAGTVETVDPILGALYG
jgi:hypothetical protein